MRILQLHLMKYGPFTDTRLELEGTGCIHFICGPNEAGKSSALRALHALLYGIPTQTTDSFLHGYKDLRIGALLLGKNEPIQVFRKKGNKGTLLNAENHPLPDGFMEDLLGSVDEEQFKTMFGIDHGRLVDGGKEILRGHGNLSAALFAGTGIAGARALLSTLDEEANSLFSPSTRARNPRINEGLARIRDLRDQTKKALLKPEAWESEVGRSDQARERMEELRKSSAATGAHLQTSKQIEAAIPLLGEWDNVCQALSALNDAVLLRQDFKDQRVEIGQELAKASANAESAQTDIQHLKGQIDDIHLPDELLAQATLVDDLYRQLGTVAGIHRDLPEREREFKLATDAARRHLDAIRPGMDLSEADQLNLPDVRRLHVSRLGNEYGALVEAKNSAATGREELRRQIEDAEARLAGVYDLRDPAGLRAAIQTVQKAGDLEGRCDQARSELARLRDKAETKLRALTLWQGTMEQVESLAVPPPETISRFASLFDKFDQRHTSVHDEMGRIDDEIRKHQRGIADLQQNGQVPSETEVGSARARRDEGWRLVRRAWLDKEDVTAEAQSLVSALAPGGRLPEAYEESVRVADGTVDQLRRETDRVARLAALQANLDECHRRRERTQESLRALTDERSRAEKEWFAVWTESGIKPLPPREMREWMGNHSMLASSAAAVRERLAGVAELDGQKQRFRDLLNARLRELSEADVAADQPLAAVLLQCDRLATGLEERARTVAQLKNDLAGYQRKLRQAEAVATDAANKLNAWQVQWAEAVTPLGLPADASPEQTNARLMTITSLFDELRKAKEAEARIWQMKQCGEAFEAKVRELVAKVAPDLNTLPADQAVGELHRRCQSAEKQQQQLGNLQKQLADRSKALQKAETGIRALQEELEKLCQEAHCSNAAELPDAERRCDEKRRLLEKQEAHRRTLSAHAGNVPFDDFLRRLREAQPAELAIQIAEQEQKLQGLQEVIEQRRNELAVATAELNRMDGSSVAAELLQESYGEAARIQPDVERYVRLRFAADILRQAMERYRQDNQDPVLKRAGELFATLTLSSFARLEADIDDHDEPVLLGIRPGGERLTVDEMSTGTRDQLYLALRFASLERYVERGHVMPFIVDDVLVNFDDRRAKATLQILAELASKTQIVFFTHHEHLVTLAKSSLPLEKVRVLSLGR